MKIFLIQFATLGLVVSQVGVSRAQNESPAEVAFREGRQLMDAGRYAEACEKMAQSQKLEPAIGTLTNLGVCHEKLGKLATAWKHLTEAAEAATRAGEADRAKTIREYAASLEPRLTKLFLQLDLDERPTNLKITLDANDVTPLLNTAAPVDSGRYTINVTGEGVKPWTKVVDVTGEGKTITVDIGLEPLATTPLEVDPKDSRTPNQEDDSTQVDSATTIQLPKKSEDNEPGGSRRTLVLGLGAGGLVATAVGLGFGWQARSKRDEARDFCDSQNVCTDQQGVDLLDSALSNANISNLLVGVGLVSMTSAGVIWYLSRGRGNLGSDERSAKLIPTAHRGGAELTLMGRF